MIDVKRDTILMLKGKVCIVCGEPTEYSFRNPNDRDKIFVCCLSHEREHERWRRENAIPNNR